MTARPLRPHPAPRRSGHSRRAFERITGPKTEWWLVQMTGALVAGWALSLAAIAAISVARRRISPAYLLDTAAQGAIAGGLWATRNEAADGRRSFADGARLGERGDVTRV
jgi:hypothetical protein